MSFLRSLGPFAIGMGMSLAPALAMDAHIAHPFSPGLAADGLIAYARGMALMHRAEESCSGKKDASYAVASRQMLASLAANGFSGKQIAAMSSALSDLPTDLPAVDCKSEDVQNDLIWLEKNPWSMQVSDRLSYLELRFIENPATEQELAAVRAIVEKNAKPQARMLECASVTWTGPFLYVLGDWNDLVGDVADMLAQKGVAADEIAAILAPVQTDRIWQLTPPEKQAEVAAGCRAEKEWQERMEIFAYYNFKPDIEKALGLQP